MALNTPPKPPTSSTRIVELDDSLSGKVALLYQQMASMDDETFKKRLKELMDEAKANLTRE